MTDLIEQFKNMTLGELTVFNRQFEETFGVTATQPVQLREPEPTEPEEDEPTAFNVVLVAPGEKRINVIKVVRELAKLGLKEAKDLVEAAPAKVLENVDADRAEIAKSALETAGATVLVQGA